MTRTKIVYVVYVHNSLIVKIQALELYLQGFEHVNNPLRR
jgi:hypothetical protein